MSQIVTKESLNVLASLVFAEMRYDGGPAKPIYNLNGGAGSELYQVLHQHYPERFKTEAQSDFASGFTQGAEFGLSVAAAIVTHGFDHAAVMQAVKSELESDDRFWPEAEPNAA
jgi:hypothetical protein